MAGAPSSSSTTGTSPSPSPSPSPSTTTGGTTTAGTPTSLEEGSVDCQVSVRTRVMVLGPGRFELIATATNETGGPITANLIADCPGPAASFVGLPDGFDVTDRCTQGACAGGALSRTPMALAPGASVDFVRSILETGATSCHGALPAGAFTVGARMRLEGIRTCMTGRATIEVGAPGVVPVEPAPPVRNPPRERRDPPPAPPAPPREPRERCPAMACAYSPCPPGVEPPTGCAAVCGCPGSSRNPFDHLAPPQVEAP